MNTQISLPHFILLTALAFTACQKEAPKEAATQKEVATQVDTVLVKTHIVADRVLSLPIVASGTIISKNETKLAFKTGGIVASLGAEPGQRVQKGQLIASLNLTEVNAQTGQSSQSQQKAQRDLNRVKRLYADTAATLEQLQNATTQLELATSGLNIARFNQQYSRIYAPANGVILRRLTEVGEIVTPGSAVYDFAATGNTTWIVRVGVADRDVVRLRQGDRAQVKLDAYPADVFAATVSEITPLADTRSGTFQVELRIRASDKPFVSGLVATVRITPSRQETLPTIPIVSLLEADNDQGYVYLLNTNRRSVRKQAVRVAQPQENGVAISEGLKSGDVVITDGVSYLTTQSIVNVTN